MPRLLIHVLVNDSQDLWGAGGIWYLNPSHNIPLSGTLLSTDGILALLIDHSSLIALLLEQ